MLRLSSLNLSPFSAGAPAMAVHSAQLPISRTNQKHFDAIGSLYTRSRLGEPRAQAIKRRIQLPDLCSDYSVVQDAAKELRAIDKGIPLSREFRDAENFVRRRRNAYQKAEVGAMRKVAIAREDIVKVSVDEKLEYYLRKLKNGGKFIEGAAVVTSSYFGVVDLDKLNLGLEAFKGGFGQVALIASLAVLTGNYQINLNKLRKTAANVGIDVKTQDWNGITIDWRRARIILNNRDDIFKIGFEGYKKFAHEYADGDMKKAYVIASALLSKEDFEVLNWGQQIHLKVSEVDEVKTGLEAEVKIINQGRKSDLKDFNGYKAFAKRKYCNQDMLKAYKIASALLAKEDFKVLNWGQAIQLKVSEVDKVKAELDAEVQKIRDGKKSDLEDFKGYKTFAKRKYCNQDMLKAYKIASALLAKEDFKVLNWGQAIQLKVSEVDKVKAELDAEVKKIRDGGDSNLKNFKGYKAFAKRKYCNQSMLKAHIIASALLSKEDFNLLNWGAQIPLKVSEVDEVKAELDAEVKKIKDGKDSDLKDFKGYKAFAKRKYCNQSMQKAHQIASALLSKEDFNLLNWGQKIELKVSEVDEVKAELDAEVKKIKDGKDSDLKDFKGYKTFAKRKYCNQDMLKAYKIASALLSKEDFNLLNWGQGIQLKVSEVDEVKADLEAEVQKIRDGGDSNLKNFKGYKAFAKRKYCNQDMLKAHKIASALLSKEDFKVLNWGQAIPLKVSEVDEVKAGLEAEAQKIRDGGDSNLKNFKGYKTFSKRKYCNQDMLKAHIIASALLSKEDFNLLNWGQGIQLKVSEVDEVKADLEAEVQKIRDGGDSNLKNFKGYKAFAKRKYCNQDMLKAHKIASALLSKEDFKVLNWGQAIQLKVSEVDSYVEYLREKLKDATLLGTEGFKTYLAWSRKEDAAAWQAASSLMQLFLNTSPKELEWPSRPKADDE